MAIVTSNSYNSGAYNVNLPSGVSEFSYAIMGAGGGGSGSDAGSPGATGGAGAIVYGTVTVPDGSNIRIYVGGGGGGGASSQGGAPGGGGGTSGSSSGSGGGGGRAGNSGSSGGGGGGGAVTYIEVDGGQIIAVAGGGAGAGGAGNDGSGPSSSQFGGAGGTSLTNGTSVNITAGANAANNGGDGGAGGGGGGGAPGGNAGFTPGSDSDAGGGTGGGSWYNNSYHSSAPSATNNRNSVSDLTQGGAGGGQSTAGQAGAYYIEYDDIDTRPNPISNFPTTSDADRDTLYTATTSQTIGGINQSVPASVSGGGADLEIIKNGTPQGSTSTTVVAGDTLSVRMKSSPSYGTTVTATLTVGAVGEETSGTFSIITISQPANVPNAFDFTDVTERPLSSAVTSNTVTISGLTQQASVSATATRGGASTPVEVLVNGVVASTINNGDTLALRITDTGTVVNTTTTAVVQVGGGGNVDWDVTTITSQDTTPAPFDFQDTTAQISTVATSNTQTITGINTPAALSISANPNTAVFTYSINGAAYTSATGATVSNTDTLSIRGTAPSLAGNAVTATVTIGSAATGQSSDTWRITATNASDILPDAFTLAPRTNQLENTQVYSNIVVPTGFNATTAGSVRLETVSGATNAQIRLNNVWTNVATNPSSTPFVFDPGDNFQLRLTTGSYGSSTAQMRVSFGGSSTTITGATLTSVSDGSTTLTTGTNADLSMIGNYSGGNLYTNAENKNPSVSWDFNTSSFPGGVTVASYSILLEDLSAIDPLTNNPYVHWTVTGIPNTTTSISADASAITGATIGTNYLGTAVNTDGVSAVGYSGPQPPTNENHVYRLSVTANLSGSVTTKLTQSIEFNFDTAQGTAISTNPATEPDNLTIIAGSGGGGSISVLWNVSVLASAPTNTDVSTWYSQATDKLDGLAIGSVISVMRDSQGNFGTLDGELNSRYPGFIECDGSSLSAADYPDLFDVIGNDYGGSASRTQSTTTQGSSTVTTFTYTGSFNLPDYRNRRLFGSGSVDGNIGSAPEVPTRVGPAGTGTGSVNTAGSVGGDWYIDTVDAAGTPPLEQVEGSGSTGVQGQFFSLGTVSTSGVGNTTGNANFNVAGNMNATIGPLDSPIIEAPGHTHYMLSGTGVNVNAGLLEWGSRGTLGSSRVNTNSLSNVYPGAPTAPTSFNPFGGGWNGSVTYTNYWASPKENSLQLQNNTGNQLGAIDVIQSTAQTRIYSPDGGLVTHNHYLSLTDFGDPINVYGWGNVNGAGQKTAGMGGDNTVAVAFSHTELGSSINRGNVELSGAKALIPDVVLSPNRTINLIQPFFKCKYIIKAY